MIIDRPSPFHRRSIRLKGYDYTHPGAYFITLVTNGHKCIFGEIVSGDMRLNDLGNIVQGCWSEIPDHFPETDIEPFVVMPNHFHGIITIHDQAYSRGTIYRAPTSVEKFSKPVAGSIPTIVRSYKAAVSRRARLDLGMINIWQRNYYEHIIGDQTELENMARYILANPVRWADDPEKAP